MNVTGDIHNIAAEVQKFDPNYHLKLNEHIGAYQVVERRPHKRFEGCYDGIPLFSCLDVDSVVLTVDFINAEKESPDMRIIQTLREKDVWNYPGGPKAFFENMERESAKRREKREQEHSNRLKDKIGDHHKRIVREFEGLSTKTVF